MAGNLWEWTLDAYAADAYARHAEQDPRTTEGDARTQRGGSWMSTKPGEIRTTRFVVKPQGDGYGFEVVAQETLR